MTVKVLVITQLLLSQNQMAQQPTIFTFPEYTNSCDIERIPCHSLLPVFEHYEFVLGSSS